MQVLLDHNLQRESGSWEGFEMFSRPKLNTAESLRYSRGVWACGARGAQGIPRFRQKTFNSLALIPFA